jgi:molybdopterin-guanine dinucleotide biosynthesis protein A
VSDQGRPARLAAIVLSGGTGARMGGVDKAALELDGASLLERALAATAGAAEVVVVGEPVATSRTVAWTREDPPGGGPAAGLLAGLDRLDGDAELVCVLAVDMPRVTPGTVARLARVVTGSTTVDGAVLVDAAGVPQTLAAVYRRAALLAARPARREQEQGLSVRRLVAPLRLAEVPAVGEEARDVDTWDDLRDLSR